MKDILNKKFWFSLKGFYVIAFFIITIVMPIFENYFGFTFSSVFSIILTDIWFITKEIFYDKVDKKKIVFDILFSLVVVAICLYFL